MVNGGIVTDDCDNERHAGASKDFYHRLQQTKQGTRGSIIVGSAGVTILTGLKPAPPRNLAIKTRPTPRRDWPEAKIGANDG